MSSQQRVLVIDDEEGMRELLEIVLGGDGYAVTSAEDMREVIAGMEDSKHKQEEKRLEREAFVKDIPGKVAAWRERVFEEAKKLELQPTSFYMGGSNDK